MKLTLLITFQLFTLESFALNYLEKNESLLYNFKTITGKIVMIAKDSNDSYLIVRCGTESKIQLEFPGKKKDSWNKFQFSYYLRGGGGIENLGVDLNYLTFNIYNYRFVIYDKYSSINNSKSCGIKITDMNTYIETDFKGDINTKIGSLVASFRWNSLITHGQKIYD